MEGLVTQDAKYAKGLRQFESVYLDGVPVKEPQLGLIPTTKELKGSHINTIDRLTKENFSGAINNIISRLQTQSDAFNAQSSNVYKSRVGLYTKKLEELSGFRAEMNRFLDENSGMARFGYIEYDSANVFSHSDDITGRFESGLRNDVHFPYLTTAYDFGIFLKEDVKGASTDASILKPYKKTNKKYWRS